MERGRRVRPLNRYAVWNDAVGNALTLYCSNSKRCLALQPPPRIALTTHEGLPPAQPTINGCLPSAPPVPPRDPPRFLKAPIHDKRWLNARTLYPAQAIPWFPLSIRGTYVTDPLPQSGNFLGALCCGTVTVATTFLLAVGFTTLSLRLVKSRTSEGHVAQKYPISLP